MIRGPCAAQSPHGPKQRDPWLGSGSCATMRSVSSLALGVLAVVALGPVDLTWEAPVGCPEGLSLERRLDELLRGSTATEPSLRVEARVEPQIDGFRLRAVLHDDARGLGERRELQAPDCASLAHALTLIVAVHVDALKAEINAVELQRPAFVAPAPLAITTASPPPSTSVPPRPRPAPSPRPSPAASSTLGGSLRIEGGAELGLLPGVAGGLGLMGGLTGRAWRVELGAGGWPTRTVSTATLGARLDVVAGRARACWAPAVGRWLVPVCGGGEVGGLRGAGTEGVTQPRVEWAPWAAVTASVGAAWSPLPWLGPYAAVEAQGALSRPQLRVGEQLVARVEGVGLRAWLGLEVKFASRARRSGRTQRRPPPA